MEYPELCEDAQSELKSSPVIILIIFKSLHPQVVGVITPTLFADVFHSDGFFFLLCSDLESFKIQEVFKIFKKSTEKTQEERPNLQMQLNVMQENPK